MNNYGFHDRMRLWICAVLLLLFLLSIGWLSFLCVLSSLYILWSTWFPFGVWPRSMQYIIISAKCAESARGRARLALCCFALLVSYNNKYVCICKWFLYAFFFSFICPKLSSFSIALLRIMYLMEWGGGRGWVVLDFSSFRLK